MENITEQMQIEMLLACYTHRELAQLYLSRLKEVEKLREEIIRLKDSMTRW